MKLDSLVRMRWHGGLKGCWPHNNGVGKRTPARLHLGADAMSDRAALHPDDRMVPVLPRYGCGQSQNEFGFRATDDLLEAMRRQVVAFVHDQVTVFANEVFNNALANETLY